VTPPEHQQRDVLPPLSSDPGVQGSRWNVLGRIRPRQCRWRFRRGLAAIIARRSFEFLRNDNFDATNFFRPPLSKDVLQRNQFGFGGPVYIPKLYNGKDKTFWMVNYEGQREKNGPLPLRR
jgi:hypothetical protein